MDNFLSDESSKALDVLIDTFPDSDLDQLMVALTHAQSLAGEGSASERHCAIVEHAVTFLFGDDIPDANPLAEIKCENNLLQIEKTMETDFERNVECSSTSNQNLTNMDDSIVYAPSLVNSCNVIKHSEGYGDEVGYTSNNNVSNQMDSITIKRAHECSQSTEVNDLYSKSQFYGKTKNVSTVESDIILESNKVCDITNKVTEEITASKSDTILNLAEYDDIDEEKDIATALPKNDIEIDKNDFVLDLTKDDDMDITDVKLTYKENISIIGDTLIDDELLINKPSAVFLPQTKKNKCDAKHPAKSSKKSTLDFIHSDVNVQDCDIESNDSEPLEDIPTFISNDITSLLSRQDKLDLNLGVCTTKNPVIHNHRNKDAPSSIEICDKNELVMTNLKACDNDSSCVQDDNIILNGSSFDNAIDLDSPCSSNQSPCDQNEYINIHDNVSSACKVSTVRTTIPLPQGNCSLYFSNANVKSVSISPTLLSVAQTYPAMNVHLRTPKQNNKAERINCDSDNVKDLPMSCNKAASQSSHMSQSNNCSVPCYSNSTTGVSYAHLEYVSGHGQTTSCEQVDLTCVKTEPNLNFVNVPTKLRDTPDFLMTCGGSDLNASETSTSNIKHLNKCQQFDLNTVKTEPSHNFVNVATSLRDKPGYLMTCDESDINASTSSTSKTNYHCPLLASKEPSRISNPCNMSYQSTQPTTMSPFSPNPYGLPVVASSSFVDKKPKLTSKQLRNALSTIETQTSQLFSNDSKTVTSSSLLFDKHDTAGPGKAIKRSSSIGTNQSPTKKLCKTDVRSYRERNSSPDISEESNQHPLVLRRDSNEDQLPELGGSLMTCEGCDSTVSLERVSQCAHAHVICVSCVEEEVRCVMSTDKLELTCPKKDCKSIIRTSSLESLLPSLVVDLVKQNLHQKELNASKVAIQGLQGMVRCPLCSYGVLMDERALQFRCGGHNCSVVCCRHCQCSWGNSSASDHQFCVMLTFIGQACLSDITKMPSNWLAAAFAGNKAWVTVPLPLESQEGQLICSYFNQTSMQKKGKQRKAQVKKLWRVQNKKLWEKYVLKRMHIADEISMEGLNEKYLFHGTARANIDQICSEGFDMRVPTKNGAVLGKGIYLAVEASYSMAYSTNCPLMFLARAVCGMSTLGNASLTRPPKSSSLTGQRLYDSCVDNVARPGKYVIFDNSQVYPEFLLEF